ncbi:MAG: tRNA (adenosine(37)-N6)-dimethylallyltransferase MiaA [Patescibacteria group bacterium]|nr:tRNA (adenosine(37)-N6)-dimethylallyltransferase MiaA [Patescibacteria group bacterium]
MSKKAVAVVGPTAAGKTSLALKLAKEFKGEIVSADSRQLYRGTDICTDIPDGKWKSFGAGPGGCRGCRGRRAYMVEGVPHYMLAAYSPVKMITMGQYRERAVRRLREIASRRKLPMLVGGTGLYIRAIVDGFVIPPVEPNPALRTKFEKMAVERLYSMLVDRDRDYADSISPNNKRYIIRALEVMEATGERFSVLQGRRAESDYDFLQIGVSRPREELYRRINERVDWMIENGLLEEAERLARRYGWEAPIITGTLGYAQLRGYSLGEYDLDEAIRLIKRDTRHYARRQLTWLRRDERIHWVRSENDAKKRVRQFLNQKQS